MLQGQARRRYLLRFIPSMALYAISVIGVNWLFHSVTVEGWPRLLIAIVPALPIMGVIGSMGLYLVEETDEYLRMLQIRALLWATGITLVVTTAWGFLETYAGVQHFPLYFVFVLFCVSLGVATTWTQWRRD